jgi:hypothetical protein
MERMMNGFIEGTDNTLTSSNFMYFKTYKTLNFSSKSTTDITDARILSVGNKFFLLTAGRPLNLSSNSQKFLNSFDPK